MGFTKYIGGALGWALGGPIGGVLGFAVGSIFDGGSKEKQQNFRGGQANSRDYQQKYQQYRHNTSQADFASVLIVLSAAVMKADGKLMKSELNFIRQFFETNFGEAAAAEQMGTLQDLLKKDIPVAEVCAQVKYFMEHPMRLQLMHYLFGIAKSDGDVDASEVEVIYQISRGLGISEKDYQSIRAMFYKDPAGAYMILEITDKATDSEVKKAYRHMAKKYHPDKVSQLGPEHVKAAKGKFIKVQEAYETIKKERKMS
jgi:DnaJ like chaperone protein